MQIPKKIFSQKCQLIILYLLTCKKYKNIFYCSCQTKKKKKEDKSNPIFIFFTAAPLRFSNKKDRLRTTKKGGVKTEKI